MAKRTITSGVPSRLPPNDGMEAYFDDKESSIEETKSPVKVRELNEDYGL
jgi:hypothetical protein